LRLISLTVLQHKNGIHRLGVSVKTIHRRLT